MVGGFSESHVCPNASPNCTYNIMKQSVNTGKAFIVQRSRSSLKIQKVYVQIKILEDRYPMISNLSISHLRLHMHLHAISRGRNSTTSKNYHF